MLTQVGEGAAEAVELPDDEHVARPERAHATVESRSVVYAGREVLVDVDGVDARSAAGTATGSRLPSSRGRRRSACIVNGRLRHTGEDAVRRAPPCVVSRVGFYVLQTSSERAAALPLSFLQYPFQRFHAERLKGGVLVEGELSQLPV